MVAATIERCPRQMMLRELVMNALEAAAQANDAPKRVKIDTVSIDGAAKLRIWNTGRGLSASELLQISDISSSLFKTVSLDGNFGMGAKAASLASNKLGLRYRSCRLGKVSQIVLGARDGVYGRLMQASAEGGEGRQDVIDITAACRAAGEDLSHDWTDVTLYGNTPGQNTAADPYDGDPVAPKDWVLQTLGQRFVRLPAGVELVIEPAANGGAPRQVFAPCFTAARFDRFETVEAGEGVVIHYGYRAKDSQLPPAQVKTAGLGAVAFDGEIYALTDERRWALEAPTYGFPFAARQCTVILELPRAFRARPEQYRQFLRFVDGDQRQVQFADFGDLVRRHLPEWLKRIIASLLPAGSDYLAEIREEMQRLLVELGLDDLLRAAPAPKNGVPSAPAAASPPVASAKPPKPQRPRLPTPPEIITIENEADIVEKALGGRAARYYPATRQVFVNARYGAIARLKAQLAEEFSVFAEAETVTRLAKTAAEWAITQRIARTLVHSLAKPKSGWSTEEVKTVQSPETMSLLVDDIEPLLAPARRRMSGQLGLEAPPQEVAGFGGDPAASRAAGELAEAEAHLQRALAGNRRDLGRFYRQIAAIHMRQRDGAAARAWLEKGMAAEPGDPWTRHDFAGLLLGENDLDGAAAASDEALALASDNKMQLLRRRAEVEIRRGDRQRAATLLDEAIRKDPESPWPHFDLAGLHLANEQFEAAESAASAAFERAPTPSAPLLRRQAEIKQRRGDETAARALYEEALALDPADPWTLLALAGLDQRQGLLQEAIDRLDAALAQRPVAEARFHRALSECEMQRGEMAAALAAAQRAVRADLADPWSQMHLAAVWRAIGDFERAAEAAAEAARLAPTLAAAPRRQGEIEGARGNSDGALKHFAAALTLAPDDPWTWLAISSQRLALNELDAADEAATIAGGKLSPTERARALRLRAQVAMRRKDFAAAQALLREATEAAPRDPWGHHETAGLALAQGDLAKAAGSAQAALAASPTPHPALLMRAAAVAERQGEHETAHGLLRKATAVAPNDPQPWSALSNHLSARGDLAGAREAAETAVSVATGAATAERKP